MRRIAVEHIADQHERLAVLFAHVTGYANAPGEHGENLVASIVALHELLMAHFADEEWFMEDIRYPQLSGHRWQHEVMAKQASEIIAAVRAGTDTLPEQVALLHEIVVDHTAEADQDFLRFHQVSK
jgi:hemerythrin-like metal-binding protein